MKNRFFSADDIPLALMYAVRLLYPYRPFLDDYIQYHVYSLHNNPIRNIYFGIGLFAARPVASFLDIALWSHFWGNLGVLYILFSVLYLAFLFLLRHFAQGLGIRLGNVFMYLSALCPINIEATAWLSASTRIVGGLFFSVLCIILISEKRNPTKMTAFVLINFISYCFYEQTAIFCLVCVCFAAVTKKRKFYFVAALFNMALLGAWYLCFSKYSVFGYRTVISLENFAHFPLEFSKALRAVFYTFADAGALLFIVPPIFAALWLKGCDFAAASRNKILFGISVAVFSLVPIAASGGNVPFRCLTVPLIGIFVLFDCIGGRVRKIFFCGVCSLFVVVSINEFCNYYKSTVIDEKVLNGLCEKIVQGVDYDLNDAPIYYFNSPSNHAEHISAVTSSDWALTGAVRALLNDADFPMID